MDVDWEVVSAPMLSLELLLDGEPVAAYRYVEPQKWAGFVFANERTTLFEPSENAIRARLLEEVIELLLQKA